MEALAGIDAADVFYRAAARHRTTFYGQLAAERAGYATLDLGRDPNIGPKERARFEARYTTKAARILYDTGNRDLFRNFVLGMDDVYDNEADQAMLVDLVRGYGDQDTSMKIVRTAAQRGFILPDRGYPLRMPPPDALNAPEPALVLSITRQESGFDPLVRSGVGARGMMQLMPATAAATARRVGVGYSPSMLDDPDYNMRLGSSYLGGLISSFAGSYVMAVAGYNAGPGRSTQWAAYCGDPRSSSVDPVDYIECISFSETRNYVMRVLEAVAVYRAKLRGGTTPLTLTADLRRGVYTPPAPQIQASPPVAPAGQDPTP